MNPGPAACRWWHQMDYVLVIAAVVCGWSMLRVLGGERERRVRDIVTTIASLPVAPRVEPAPTPPANTSTAGQPANSPVRSKATR